MNTISFNSTQNLTLVACSARLTAVNDSINSRISEIQSMLSSITGSTVSSSDLGVSTVASISEVRMKFENFNFQCIGATIALHFIV